MYEFSLNLKLDFPSYSTLIFIFSKIYLLSTKLLNIYEFIVLLILDVAS